jgi:hypothetical protein
MAKPGGDPMAYRSNCMNEIQFSLVLESKTPKQTGYIQLWPSTEVALASCPLNLPIKNVLSTAKYGLQPQWNPSMQGFKATNILLNMILSFIV